MFKSFFGPFCEKDLNGFVTLYFGFQRMQAWPEIIKKSKEGGLGL